MTAGLGPAPHNRPQGHNNWSNAMRYTPITPARFAIGSNRGPAIYEIVLDLLRKSSTPMTILDLRKVFVGRAETLDHVLKFLVANGDVVQTVDTDGRKVYEVDAR
jgi:hypothetical protein